MPYADPEKKRANQRERSRRSRARKHAEKYGPNAGSQAGRHGHQARGARHPKWKNGIVSSHGYVKIRVGKSHPLADPNGYAYEHHVVWYAAGRRLGPKQNLHHRNGDKTDNRIENLELLSASDHAKEHTARRGRDALGRFPRQDPPPEVRA